MVSHHSAFADVLFNLQASTTLRQAQGDKGLCPTNLLILARVTIGIIYQVLLNDHIIDHIHCFTKINIAAAQ